jgi:hypothetical protein
MGLFLRDAQEPAQAQIASVRNRSRAQPAPFNAPRAITASAERVVLNGFTTVARPYAAWQEEAWVAYERVGEVHFGFNLLASLISRIRFYAAAIGKANEPPADVSSNNSKLDPKLEDACIDLVNELFETDPGGMLRSAVLNLSVPGECYLANLPKKDGSKYWAVRSVKEIDVRANGAVLTSSRTNGQQVQNLPADTYIARIWRRHPQYSLEPDSSLLGVADAIEELLMLQRLVRSSTRTRLNAGLLFVPEGIASGINPSTTAEPPIDEPADSLSALRSQSVEDPSGKFLSDLMQSMTTPISDEGSASAVVPMLAVGAGDLGAQIRHITFERASDQWLTDRIEKVLDRVLNGLDLPKEVVTGLQNVKFSNAVVIDEGMYKANIEPLALVIADAFTAVFLRPKLLEMGFSPEEVQSVAIWYDPAEIVTRPNSAAEATEGLDRGVLSADAWRREHGYPDTDAPTQEEQAQLLLSKIAVLPDAAIIELLRKSYPKVFGDLEDPVQPQQLQQDNQPPADGEPSSVVQFPSQQKTAQPPADPQRTAIKQVGVRD